MKERLRVARRMLAETTAAGVLRDQQISGLWVDPMAIAAAKGILIEAKPDTAAGVSGMLLKVGDDFGIMYATHIPSRGFQRFSIAHELGHYFMAGHVEQVLAKGAHTSQAGFGSRDPYEQEADFFAAALLMPMRLIKPIFAGQEDGMASVKFLARECQTTLTASAVRYARMSTSAVAVVLSQNGAIDFCLFSDAMKEAKVRWPRAGTPVPSGTLTYRFGKDPRNVAQASEASESIDLMDWFDGESSHVISEEVIGLGTYGKILTVLYSRRITAASEGLDDEEEDEDKLLDSWTPRFHR